MHTTDIIVAIIASLLVGMLMAFGLVLLFVFFGSDTSCEAALYSFLS